MQSFKSQIQCNPGMVHGFTEFYTFYLSRVSRTKMGVILELEDFMAKSTHYVNLYDVGDYSYTINDDDDLFLDLDGLNKSVYVARDIPFTGTRLKLFYRCKLYYSQNSKRPFYFQFFNKMPLN